MPNIVTWVNDDIYGQWLRSGKTKQAKLKQKIREFVIKEVMK